MCIFFRSTGWLTSNKTGVFYILYIIAIVINEHDMDSLHSKLVVQYTPFVPFY
jgi:hypothetical protein